MTRVLRHVFFALALLPLLAACGASEKVAAAEQGVEDFRRLSAGKRWGEIYDGASPELKQQATRDDFVAMLRDIDTKLGAVTNGRRVGYNVNIGSGGSLVAMSYETAFERGKATEEFVYLVRDDKAALAGYSVKALDMRSGELRA